MKLSVLDEVLDGNFEEFLHKPVPVPGDVEENVAYAEEKLLAGMTEEQKNYLAIISSNILESSTNTKRHISSGASV